METGHSRDYASIAHEYAREAVADKKGKRFCKWVRLAAKRYLNDFKKFKGGKSLYYFDDWHANDACDFIEKLPHIEGVWDTPGITLEPSQIFILCSVFGWRKRSDKNRRYSHVYIEMARKNAKSTLSAGVSLYCCCCEGEVGPQIIIGATTGDQALKVFKPAKLMVDTTPDLREAFGLETWGGIIPRSITSARNNGFIQPINAKSKTQDGWNPHCVILDELHAHPDRGLFDVLSSAFGARKNPLMWIITTAGFNTNGICYEQHLYLRKILEGAVEAEHFFGVIYTLDEKDNWTDERVWIKANPLLGSACQVDQLRKRVIDAKASPNEQGDVKTKNFNIWLNATSAWLNVEKWLEAADSTLSWEDFAGLDCYIGGDLADKDDITALVLAAFDTENRLIWKPMFWLPEEILKIPEHAENRGAAPYRRWAEQGVLQLTPGDWVDHNAVEAVAREWIERFSVRMCTFDQFAAAQAMASRLNEDLGTPDRPIAQILHKKASNVTDPAKELEARVKVGAKRIRHDGNPVMNWMASNVVVSRRRDETLLPIKESQMSPNKIDGIDALINAIAPAVILKKEEPFAYDTRGVLTL